MAKARLTKRFLPTNVDKTLSQMKFIDLQRACIIRGIEFEVLVEKTVFQLQSWLGKNYTNKVKTERLDDFDRWREGLLKAAGKHDEPFVRLGFIGEVDKETGEVLSIKKPRKIKKGKRKRERNEELNIFTGTKKELTFICQKEGKTMDETKALVMEKYPDAKEKSIQIWYKKSARGKK
jgi:hypothetical protein